MPSMTTSGGGTGTCSATDGGSGGAGRCASLPGVAASSVASAIRHHAQRPRREDQPHEREA